MVLRQKTISVEVAHMRLWELKHPGESFSAWVRHIMALDVIPQTEDETSSYTLDEFPTLPTNPMIRNDHDPMATDNPEEAEARARAIYESFGQSAKQTEEKIRRFMERWREAKEFPDEKESSREW